MARKPLGAMRTETLLFSGIAIFVAIATVAYASWTKDADGKVEMTGAVCMALTSGMFCILGGYLFNTGKRFDNRPEDKPAPPVSEGSGTVGHFSPGSYWPVGMAAGGTLLLTGFAFGMWVSLIGGAIMLFFVTGLLLEHYKGEPLQMIELVSSGQIDMTPGDGEHH